MAKGNVSRLLRLIRACKKLTHYSHSTSKEGGHACIASPHTVTPHHQAERQLIIDREGGREYLSSAVQGERRRLGQNPGQTEWERSVPCANSPV